MAAFLRKLCFCADQTDSDAVPFRNSDFDPTAERSNDNKAALPSPPPTTPPEASKQRGPPPSYSLADRPTSVQTLLRVFQDANKLGGEHGITGAFNALRHRHFHVWIDDNYKLPAETQRSIRMMSQLLLLLGRAMNCDMEFFFMSQSNTNSNHLTDQEREKAKALDEVWNTQNLGDATRLIKESSILQGMGLLQWLEDSEPVATRQTTTVETPQETFVRLLDHSRDLKIPLWQGYHQRDISPADLTKAHKLAVKNAKKQPKSLNSVRFTFEREIRHYKHLKEQNQANPTTALLLTGSPLQPSEGDRIIKFQKDSAIKKTKAARGKGSEFCIETVAMIKNMDVEGVTRYQKVDSAFDGDADINDLTEVNEEELRQKGPSPTLIYKIINSHNKGVDNMHIRKEEDKYGKTAFAKSGEGLTMPTFKEVAMALGEADTDSDTE